MVARLRGDPGERGLVPERLLRLCSSRSKEGRLRAVARRTFVGIGMAGMDWSGGENKVELGLWWLVGRGSRESGGGEEDWMG